MTHRFKVGETVWVRDRSESGRGYALVEAMVREQHTHPDRHPAYPEGEGYALDGALWWDCYPGCRVFATRAEALAGRLSAPFDVSNAPTLGVAPTGALMPVVEHRCKVGHNYYNLNPDFQKCPYCEEAHDA